jgi:hypothetical protein
VLESFLCRVKLFDSMVLWFDVFLFSAYSDKYRRAVSDSMQCSYSLPNPISTLYVYPLFLNLHE